MAELSAQKANIRAAAQLVAILGRKLINENSVGLLELVKNSYDADATKVDVKLEHLRDPERTQVIVHDNGVGMDVSDVLTRWMVAGFSEKQQQVARMDPTALGRLPLGQMGIGRFATARLGKRLLVVTRKAGCPEVFFQIDWDDYDGSGKLEDVAINVVERDPQIFVNGATGTRLAMVGAAEPWTGDQVQSVHSKLLRLLSPIHQKHDFKLTFTCSEHPHLEQIRPDKVIDNWHFQLVAKIDADGKARLKINDRLAEVVASEWEELDLWAKRSRKTLLGLGRSGEHPSCGSFELEIRAWRLTAAELKKVNITDKEHVRQLSGVSVFRDGFRVLPYGEPGDDWLGLNMRRVNNATSRFSTNQVIGIVSIESGANPDLQDQANRLGLQFNSAFSDFRELTTLALSELENRTVGAAAQARARARVLAPNPVVLPPPRITSPERTTPRDPSELPPSNFTRALHEAVKAPEPPNAANNFTSKSERPDGTGDQKGPPGTLDSGVDLVLLATTLSSLDRLRREATDNEVKECLGEAWRLTERARQKSV